MGFKIDEKELEKEMNKIKNREIKTKFDKVRIYEDQQTRQFSDNELNRQQFV